MSAIAYRREIDGLRALAVVPVLLYHAEFAFFSGGYVGVDIFFVISGYLITSIILREIDGGNFSLARFYERRVRRILPTLYVVMLASLPFAALTLLPSQVKPYLDSIRYTTVFISNFLFAREAGYFDTDSGLKPFIHTWSLGVE
ncbi:MAG TPA: acyltransferase [Kaistiaceae bacterium]|nr:acyltransferase [Kaistiaceae bacterium]